MNGWYCIFECSTNEWLMADNTFMADRFFLKTPLPTRFDVVTHVNPDGSLKQDIVSTQYNEVITMVGDAGLDKRKIKRFLTMNDAENHLLTAGLLTTGNEFYSIRKIYF